MMKLVMMIAAGLLLSSCLSGCALRCFPADPNDVNGCHVSSDFLIA